MVNNMTYRTTKQNLERKAKHINMMLEELGINIDASISYAYGGASLVGDKGSRNISKNGHMPKSELYYQMATVEEIVYEISRQLRSK